jgi:hypothetical protein
VNCWSTTHIWTMSATTTTTGATIGFEAERRCLCGLLTRQEVHPLAILQAAIERLGTENERYREALAEIARQATQAINTAYGDRILRQIEIKARAALTEGVRDTPMAGGAGSCR